MPMKSHDSSWSSLQVTYLVKLIKLVSRLNSSKIHVDKGLYSYFHWGTPGQHLKGKKGKAPKKIRIDDQPAKKEKGNIQQVKFGDYT